MMESSGIKFDTDKPRLDLLSASWIQGVGQVLTYGAKKYTKDGETGANNWRKGLAFSRVIGACLRHCFSWLGGEDDDKETGLSHLLHASCCLMFLYELQITNPELDDRWKTT